MTLARASVGHIRAELGADPDLGAGNVLTTLLAKGVDPDGPGLAFDTPVGDRPAYDPLSLGTLDGLVAARAAWLHGQGIRPRDPVAVVATAAADHVLTYLALMRLGAIPAPVNGKLPPETIAAYVSRLRAVGYLAESTVDTGVRRLGSVADSAAGDPVTAPPPYRHGPDDPIAITHSSGTTGVPKAVVHAHRTLFASIRHRLAMPMVHGSDRMLSALPTPHSATVIAVNLALCNRAELLAVSTQDGPAVVDAIARWRPGVVLGFSVTWSSLARMDLARHDIGSVQVWWNTGDAAHEAHIRKLVAVGNHREATAGGPVDRPGSRFVDGLGSTEMGHSMFHITHRRDTDRYGRCIGRPHTFVDVAVVGRDGEPLPPGEVGELAVRSPTLAPGYWNDSLTTYRTRWRDYFLTGDLVYYDTAGYYYHVDRAADAVDLGDGKHLYTALCEERILAACPDVVDCTVSAVRRDGTVVTDVLLILGAGADPRVDRSAQVRDALDEHVAATIRGVASVSPDQIPTGVTGKVRKLAVRESQVA